MTNLRMARMPDFSFQILVCLGALRSFLLGCWDCYRRTSSILHGKSCQTFRSILLLIMLRINFMIIALYWLNLQITNFCFDIFYAQCSGMIKLYIIGCDIRAKNVCIFSTYLSKFCYLVPAGYPIQRIRIYWKPFNFFSAQKFIVYRRRGGVNKIINTLQNILRHV